MICGSVPPLHRERTKTQNGLGNGSKNGSIKRSPSNWLKIEKISMDYPWDWFKSPFPWVSHGTHLSHQNPWDTHGNVLSQSVDLSCLDILFHPISHGTILSQFIKEYAPVISHHQSTSLLITKPLAQWLKMVPWVIVLHALFHGTILSQVIQEYAPVISHYQSNSLLITKSLADIDLKWSQEYSMHYFMGPF